MGISYNVLCYKFEKVLVMGSEAINIFAHFEDIPFALTVHLALVATVLAKQIVKWNW